MMSDNVCVAGITHAQLLAAEQARWVDLNVKLDELERLLGPVREQRMR